MACQRRLHLIVTRLLSRWLPPDGPRRAVSVAAGGVVAALSTAFSTSFWSNATEAEVYALSMCITLVAFWAALLWQDTATPDRDRYLLFVAYLYGLGAGVHLQCPLTAPAILIVVYAELLRSRSRRLQAAVLFGLVAAPFAAMVGPPAFTIALGLAVVAGLVTLNPAWRNAGFWACGLLLVGVGFSTYLALLVRSGLNPVMDLGDPENWHNFQLFLTRQQYGVHYLFPRKAAFLAYQLNIHLKYFAEQFPLLFDTSLIFRKAVPSQEGAFEAVRVSIPPLAIGLLGLGYHLRRSWRSFAAVCSMFALMGIGLVVYLNMPDPEPREREYIFVGSYVVFAMWMGIGATCVVDWVGRHSRSLPLAIGTSALALGIPGGFLYNNAASHDRTGDTVARDYAYNLLQTCEKDSILFTNGDNDTYPVWYLQNVEGVRTDVQVVNLSFVKTPWYVRQLQEKEPPVPFGLSEAALAEGFGYLPWREPRDLNVAGLAVKAEEVPTRQYETAAGPMPVLDANTYMTWRLVTGNDWQRPIYFAMSVPESNMAGLMPYLALEGVAYRLERRRGPGIINVQKVHRCVMDVYRYASFADPAVYKDRVARRLWSNYLVAFDALTQACIQLEQPERGMQVMRKAEVAIPPAVLGPEFSDTWQAVARRYLLLARLFTRKGEDARAIECLEDYVRLSPAAPDADQVKALIDQCKA